MPNGPKVAIVVEFRAKPGMAREFEAHIRDHAARTLAEEPGCERFDVLQPLKQDGMPDLGRILLFELYSSHAAFDAHRDNPRMKEVGPRGAELIESRVLHRCEVVAT
ncbi:MAG TPA: putative quinol monooxygenase [Acetobacteraceae bacterium]|jgi:quinol monooxygenase YgiN|nr:putative quinol monooxygenase [Acetobacteraceae bacterium]